MRQFDRMCKANAGCFNCPLHKPDGVPDECSIGAFVNDSERIEREVMAWAAEHPEPVYPTWVEYLVGIGVIPHEIRLETADALMDTNLLKPIPDDIAQKLGIEPKER